MEESVLPSKIKSKPVLVKMNVNAENNTYIIKIP